MSSLATEYLGIQFDNPILVGASSLTLNVAAVEKCARAGAGGVVLKSLFEEQVRLEAQTLNESLAAAATGHSEVFEYMEADIGMRYGTRQYLQIVHDCKQTVEIPVIASINCVSAEWWLDFAAEVAAAGADALELNVAIMPATLTVSGREIEDRCAEIVSTARHAVPIPIAVKLGPYFSSLPHVVRRLKQAGADGFVLFNRFYRPTIDVDELKMSVDSPYSSPAEFSPVLRWICLLANRIAADFAATTGIHTGEDVVRALLGGAKAVQVVSALYQNGVDHVQNLRNDLSEWMQRHGYDSIEAFRGLMCRAQRPDSEALERIQYIKGLVGIE